MKFDLLNVINELVGYYHANRGVGHSVVGSKGAKEDGGILVVRDQEQMQVTDIKGTSVSGILTLAGVSHGGLRGHTSPLVVDHYAMCDLLGQAATELVSLRSFKQHAEHALEAGLKAMLRNRGTISRLQVENEKLSQKLAEREAPAQASDDEARRLHMWWEKAVRERDALEAENINLTRELRLARAQAVDKLSDSDSSAIELEAMAEAVALLADKEPPHIT